MWRPECPKTLGPHAPCEETETVRQRAPTRLSQGIRCHGSAVEGDALCSTIYLR